MPDKITLLKSPSLLPLQSPRSTGDKAGTQKEENLWKFLKHHHLGYKFRRQSRVPYSDYIADFRCVELGLIVEIDGPHHRSMEGKAHDQERDKITATLGWKTLRLKEDLSPWEMCQQIIERIQAMGRKVKLPPSTLVPQFFCQYCQREHDQDKHQCKE